jgi:hypothetical protein
MASFRFDYLELELKVKRNLAVNRYVLNEEALPSTDGSQAHRSQNQ